MLSKLKILELLGVVLVSSVLFGVQFAHAANYYISSTGSDSNNGTSPSSPWQTVAKVNSSTFNPGDTINFNGGNTFTGTVEPTLIGSTSSPITIDSYGTGQATISVGSGVVHGILLTNPQNVIINNLTLTGAGWTGTGSGAVALNGGYGVAVIVTATSGPPTSNITVTNCNVSGFWTGIWMDSGKTSNVSGTVGLENITIDNNYVFNDMEQGILVQGYDTDEGGPVNQLLNININNNIIINIPGDPEAGSGGVHGTIAGDASAVNLGNATGFSLNNNVAYAAGGFGGYFTGVTFGGSTGMVASNSASGTIDYNEVANTKSVVRYDGDAIDVDQDSSNIEVAYNLTYNNVGPSVQWGSFGGFTTSNIRVHHNISYDDVRGNNTNGISRQGAIRIWDGTNQSQIFDNTIYVNAAGTFGSPSAFEIEGSANSNMTIVDNIFKVTSGIPILDGNGDNFGNAVIVGNLYDPSSGSLLISNNNGSGAANITSLAAWQGLGYETFDATDYGFAGSSSLRNINTFSPPTDGFIDNGVKISSITNFDLAPISPAIGLGINPSLVGISIGSSDYHGNASSRNGVYDSGASIYTAIPSTILTGSAGLAGEVVIK